MKSSTFGSSCVVRSHVQDSLLNSAVVFWAGSQVWSVFFKSVLGVSVSARGLSPACEASAPGAFRPFGGHAMNARFSFPSVKSARLGS
jgi:hypothetical protein